MMVLVKKQKAFDAALIVTMRMTMRKSMMKVMRSDGNKDQKMIIAMMITSVFLSARILTLMIVMVRMTHSDAVLMILMMVISPPT